MSDEPVAKFHLGNVTATIWEKDEGAVSMAIDLSCSYKDGDKWISGTSLRAGDLLNAAKVLHRAEEWLSGR
jgi:hypothetical protein